MNFYVGYHQPGRAHKVGRPVMISHNRLVDRVSDFEVGEWILDSGAFTQITKYGEFQVSPSEYAKGIERWAQCGDMQAAISQDYMCEDVALEATGKDVMTHQMWTLRRYRQIRDALDADVHLMPVLQGKTAKDYAFHARCFRKMVSDDTWIGVGSVCKRNGSPADIEMILSAIKNECPNFRLHGFGIKSTALGRLRIRTMLYSADSMAWSYRARHNGGDANCPQEAQEFYDELTTAQTQTPLFN